MPQTALQNRIAGADEAGVLVSGLCVVHCLALPFLLLLTPTLGLVLTQPVVHQMLAVLAAGSVVFGLYPPAWTSRRWGLAALGTLGALLVGASAFVGSDACCSLLLALTEGRTLAADVPPEGWASLLATPLGCLLIGAAHVLNRRVILCPVPDCGAHCPASAVATSA
jgi:hypothetical protein